MQPTDVLKNEHQVILRVLASLEVFARRTQESGALDSEPGAQFVDFIRTFADRCHHGKEEDRLFPLLVEKGFPREAGPIAVMLHEHDEGRALVGRMHAAVEGQGDPARDYSQAAGAFVDLLRDHIAREDNVLYPMGDSALSEEDQAALLASFERFEKDEMGPDTHERYLRLARELCDRYGIEWDAEVQAAAASPCCGHHKPDPAG